MRGLASAAKLPTVLALLGTVTCLTGCVSIPPESLSEPIDVNELSAHVNFLAQPALKGRAPRTRGAKNARRYIRSRFEDYGLVPWGTAKGYAQSFGLGTNMIGVLPGTDPNLAQEIVIVSAHYDHLGKTDQGICLGASDNASGVAALLEIAERMALSHDRPRRTICFAAFDCEETMLLGAYAFVCREDFHDAAIAGVVNIDALGRNAYELMDRHLFVTGTESFPDLRAQIETRAPEDMTLLPIGTEIIGARGDHVVFEALDTPALFFSSGPYADYHRPTDTPEKLDYGAMQESAEVIVEAIRTIANSDRRYSCTRSDKGDIEELQAFKTCLDQIRNGYETMGWTEMQAAKFDPVIAKIDRFLEEGQYTRQDRLDLLRSSAGTLLPLAVWPEPFGDPNDPNEIQLDDTMIVVQTIQSEHRALFVRSTRRLIKSLLPRRIDFLLGRPIVHAVIDADIPDHLIFIEPVDRTRYKLDFLVLSLALTVHINNPSGMGIQLDYALQVSDFTGTEDELTDYGLLLCYNPNRAMWQTPLRRVTGAAPASTYEQMRDARLAEGGWDNESEWILDLIHSENPRLRYMALLMLPKIVGDRAEPMLLGVLADPNAAAMDRQAALTSVGTGSSIETLLAVANTLSDNTQIKHLLQQRYERLTRPDTPFKSYPLVPLAVRLLDEWLEKNLQEPWMISDLAQERLKAATKQDLGDDPVAWRQWIEANWTSATDP